jgi:hypothetical protein
MFKNKKIDIHRLPTTNKMLEVVIIGESFRSNGTLEVSNLISITQLKIVKAYGVIETLSTVSG